MKSKTYPVMAEGKLNRVCKKRREADFSRRSERRDRGGGCLTEVLRAERAGLSAQESDTAVTRALIGGGGLGPLFPSNSRLGNAMDVAMEHKPYVIRDRTVLS